MGVAILMVIAFVLFGCATAEEGKRITPDDVTWIERETSTRAEVVARFGSPPAEFPQSSGFTTTATTTAITTTDSDGHTRTIQTTTQIQRPRSLRKATYVYTHRDSAAFPFFDNVHSTQSQFWVLYDEKGVVQDYGFLGDPPDSPVKRHPQTIATAPQLTDNAVGDPESP